MTTLTTPTDHPETRHPSTLVPAALSTLQPAGPADLPAVPAELMRGWHPDPWASHHLRFHDGDTWTDHVTHFGPVPCVGCNSAPSAAT